jgi:hypothetical protein
MSRGPERQLPLPPADLAARSLPLTALPAGLTLQRIHLLRHQSLFFSPGPGAPPLGRFDSLGDCFGVLYTARTFAGAVVETLLRNPDEPLVTWARLSARGLATLATSRPLRLVDLTGPGLSQLGLDARFTSGAYDLCGAWADAWQAHPSVPDGILHPSRLDPSEHCVALFDRAAAALAQDGESAPLSTLREEVAAVLNRYGKAVETE